MTEKTSTNSQAAALPAPGHYHLDAGSSTIRSSTKAMYGLFSVKGTFRLRDGEVVIAEDPADSTIRATIDASSFESGNTKRDQDVSSPALLDADRYPDITYAGTGARAERDGWIVDGMVGAHGTTDPLQVRISEARAEGDGVYFRATANLDRTQLGVTGKKGMVGRVVKLSLEARGTLKPPAAPDDPSR